MITALAFSCEFALELVDCITWGTVESISAFVSCFVASTWLVTLAFSKLCCFPRGLGTGLPDPGGSKGSFGFAPSITPFEVAAMACGCSGGSNPTEVGTDEGETTVGLALEEEVTDILCPRVRGRGVGLAGAGRGSPEGNMSRSSSPPGDTLRLRQRPVESSRTKGLGITGSSASCCCEGSLLGEALVFCSLSCSSLICSFSSSFSVLKSGSALDLERD